MTVVKRLAYLIPVLIILGACDAMDTPDGEQPPDEEQAIRDLLMAQQKDWNAGDIEAFMEGYVKSDTLRFASSSGEVLGWDATLQRYRNAYPDRSAMGNLSLELRDIDVLGPGYATVFGAYSLRRATDNPTGLFTLVLVKTDLGWRIVHDHTTSDES